MKMPKINSVQINKDSNIYKIFELFLKDYNKIINTLEEKKVPREKIELIQESYVYGLLSKLLQGSGMPADVKRKLLHKLESDLYKIKAGKIFLKN